MMGTTMRWLSVIGAVIGCFLISGIAATLVAGGLGLWWEPIIGSVCSVAVVLGAFVLAPNHKAHSATVALVLGAATAW